MHRVLEISFELVVIKWPPRTTRSKCRLEVVDAAQLQCRCDHRMVGQDRRWDVRGFGAPGAEQDHLPLTWHIAPSCTHVYKRSGIKMQVRWCWLKLLISQNLTLYYFCRYTTTRYIIGRCLPTHADSAFSRSCSSPTTRTTWIRTLPGTRDTSAGQCLTCRASAPSGFRAYETCTPMSPSVIRTASTMATPTETSSLTEDSLARCTLSPRCTQHVHNRDSFSVIFRPFRQFEKPKFSCGYIPNLDIICKI